MDVSTPMPVTNWADMDQENEDGAIETGGLITVDHEGNRVITTYFRDAHGTQMKSQRKLKVHRRVHRVSVAAQERQNTWKSFGYEALDLNQGDNKVYKVSISTQDEQLKIPRNFGWITGDDQEDYDMLVNNGSELILQKRQLADIQRYFDMINNPDPRMLLALAEKEDTGQPTSALPERGHLKSQETEDRTIRVTNLPEYTTEDDLQVLFGRCGQVARCFLARNKETMVSKGFAFITFRMRSEAENAISKLHKVGFQNVLINVEWTKRKLPNEVDSTNPAGGGGGMA